MLLRNGPFFAAPRPWRVRWAAAASVALCGLVVPTAVAAEPVPLTEPLVVVVTESATTSIEAAPTPVAPSGPTTTLADIRSVIRAGAAGLTGQGIDIAMIDSGISPVPELNAPGKVLNGPDLSFDGADPALRNLDALGHGTHMAAIAAGRSGVAPGARLVNVKVGSAAGAVDVSQVVAALDWVVEHRNDNGLNIRVLNLSLGLESAHDAQVDPLAYAVDRAWRAGIVVVAAAGNDGKGDRRLSSPAINPNIVAVGAVDMGGSTAREDARLASFSGAGDHTRSPDVVAPGTRIASARVPGSILDLTYPAARVGDQLFRGSGTSQAAAVVSGAAALLLQQRPELSPAQVKELLKASATKVPGSTRIGGDGLIDVGQATSAATPTSTPALVPMSGTGSLEGTRNDRHVARGSRVLSGELDASGQPFDVAAWLQRIASVGTWSGGSWSGNSWSGGSWSGGSWSGNSWSGNSWSGSSWSGNSWSGSSWSGNSWSGSSWSGNSWSGSSWSGSSWSSDGWYGISWG